MWNKTHLKYHRVQLERIVTQVKQVIFPYANQKGHQAETKGTYHVELYPFQGTTQSQGSTFGS